MRTPIEITGNNFNRLTAIRCTGEKRKGLAVWEFLCDCGKTVFIPATQVIRGNNRSCGCLKLEKIKALKFSHGKNGSDVNVIWQRMNQRCHNPTCGDFKYYGARGVFVCDDWRKDFAAFSDHIGARPTPLHTVERIDNSKGYEPGNVKWATRMEQMRNTRRSHFVEVGGERLIISEWARRLGVHDSAIFARVKRGMTMEQAVTTPRMAGCA